MKNIRIVLIVCIFAVLLTGCNSREDVKHISKKRMINYVEGAIGEDITLLRVEGKEEDAQMTYVFQLDERDITFTATSGINATFIDGTQFGNYKEEIYINYEEDIVESEFYIKERLRIAKELDIEDDDMEYGLAIINVDNYEDIDEVAKFVVELDKLYAFKETKPNRVEHIDVGAVSFRDPSASIDGVQFSNNKDKRLDYDKVYNDLVSSYIKQLKMFDAYDNTIPKDVWDSH